MNGMNMAGNGRYGVPFQPGQGFGPAHKALAPASMMKVMQAAMRARAQGNYSPNPNAGDDRFNPQPHFGGGYKPPTPGFSGLEHSQAIAHSFPPNLAQLLYGMGQPDEGRIFDGPDPATGYPGYVEQNPSGGMSPEAAPMDGMGIPGQQRRVGAVNTAQQMAAALSKRLAAKMGNNIPQRNRAFQAM